MIRYAAFKRSICEPRTSLQDARLSGQMPKIPGSSPGASYGKLLSHLFGIIYEVQTY